LLEHPHLNARNVISALILAGAALTAGCVHAPLNRPLSTAAAASQPPSPSVTRTPGNDVMVALFFSGGGTRAASLSLCAISCSGDIFMKRITSWNMNRTSAKSVVTFSFAIS
jgi:hypothetical protein